MASSGFEGLCRMWSISENDVNRSLTILAKFERCALTAIKISIDILVRKSGGRTRVVAEDSVVVVLEGPEGPSNRLTCAIVAIWTGWECVTEEHVVKSKGRREVNELPPGCRERTAQRKLSILRWWEGEGNDRLNRTDWTSNLGRGLGGN